MLTLPQHLPAGLRGSRVREGTYVTPFCQLLSTVTSPWTLPSQKESLGNQPPLRRHAGDLRVLRLNLSYLQWVHMLCFERLVLSW